MFGGLPRRLVVRTRSRRSSGGRDAPCWSGNSKRREPETGFASAMRSRSHADVWALGDCAAIPGPDGRPYPALAQHAVREARHLASNIAAVQKSGLITNAVCFAWERKPLMTSDPAGGTSA